MNARRDFLKFAPAAALPVAGAMFSGNDLYAGDQHSTDSQANYKGGEELVGSWNSVHTLPFPPGSFREFVSFNEGGILAETNSFLHTASDVDFSGVGLPGATSVNASDGVGTWYRLRDNLYQAVFRKLLFNGSRENFADLLVTGSLRVSRGKLSVAWHVQVVNLAGDLLFDFGQSTSEGTRLTG